MTTEAIKVLREAFRVSRKLTSEVIRRKFRFNAREAVDFYLHLGDTNLAAERLAQSWKVLETFDKMLSAREDLAKKVFRPFEFMESPDKTCQRKTVGPMSIDGRDDINSDV